MSISLTSNSTKKLNLIDRFREQFSVEENEKLNLPQIVVVGDQSSGKSSILEAISGIKLPKGVDTVTKCPLIIHMRTNENEKTRLKYRNTEKFFDLSNTENEVFKIQKEVFKDQLTKEPINIFIESSKVPTLTVIDMPGIIKTATTGHTIESKEKTVEIAKFYMQQENSLILCVLPANQDISTTTTIDLAKECNKDKSRIIGVLTKIDKLDNKEMKMLPDILKNIKLPIDKGYYGLVVGDEFLELSEEDREKFEERKFQNLCLADHKKRLGLKNFVEVLKRELSTLINRSIPILKINIELFIDETKKSLEGVSMYYGCIELQKQYVINTIKEIENKTKAMVAVGDGEIENYSTMAPFLQNNVYLKPVMEHQTFLSVWHSIFEDLYDSCYNTFEKFLISEGAKYKNPRKLEELIKSVPTERNSMFDNPKPFKIVIDMVLKEFEDISKRCVNKCSLIMKQMIENEIVSHVDEKLFTMKNDIKKRGMEILDKQKKKTLKKLQFLFQSENLLFIQNKVANLFVKNSSNLEMENVYVQDHSKMNLYEQQQLQRPVVPVNSSIIKLVDRNSSYAENVKYENGKKLKKNLENYLTNLIQRLGDVIPNFIVLSLFVKFNESFINELWKLLFQEEKLSYYFCLSNDEKIKTDNLKKRLSSLEKFNTELREISNDSPKFRYVLDTEEE